MSVKEWSEKCYIVLQNEVFPRATKLNITPRQFIDPVFLSNLIRLEYEGVMSRKDLRDILDIRVKTYKRETT